MRRYDDEPEEREPVEPEREIECYLCGSDQATSRGRPCRICVRAGRAHPMDLFDVDGRPVQLSE